MQRPFLIVSVLSLILSFLSLYSGWAAVLIFSVAIAVFGLLFFLKVKKQFAKILVPLFFLALAIINAFYNINVSQKAEALPQNLIVKGVVTETPTIYENGQTVTLKIPSLNTKASIFSFNTYDIKAGDKVTASIKVTPQETYKGANYSQGVYINSFLQEVKEIKRPKFSVYRLVADYRDGIEQTILNKASDKNAPILVALATGNKYHINKTDQKYINNCGVSHIMAVSGLHLGILSLNLAKILRKCKVKEKTISILGLLSIAFVVTACGFQLSAMRAAVVYVILFVGNLIRRKVEGLNSLCVAITLMVAANPFVIGSVSFLLSVSATFGILVLFPMLSGLLGKVKQGGKFGKLCNYVLDVGLVSFSAIICSMPILVYYFGTISTVAILVNVLILFAATTTLILTVVGLIISVIPLISILNSVMFFIAEVFTEYFMAVVRFFGKMEHSVVYVRKEMSIFWIIFAIVIIMLSYVGLKNAKRSERIGTK